MRNRECERVLAEVEEEARQREEEELVKEAGEGNAEEKQVC